MLDFRIKECYGEILGFEKSWFFTPEGWALWEIDYLHMFVEQNFGIMLELLLV